MIGTVTIRSNMIGTTIEARVVFVPASESDEELKRIRALFNHSGEAIEFKNSTILPDEVAKDVITACKDKNGDYSIEDFIGAFPTYHQKELRKFAGLEPVTPEEVQEEPATDNVLVVGIWQGEGQRVLSYTAPTPTPQAAAEAFRANADGVSPIVILVLKDNKIISTWRATVNY
jgi:hypothetical protein